MPISILHLEDSDLDSDLVNHHLEASGIVFNMHRVWTRDDFVEQLEHRRFDVILADYKLPAFDGFTALQLAKDLAPNTPFIFVSATLGEEVAIESLKNGATDYVIKSRLGRLSSCIERAIAERAEILGRVRAEQAADDTYSRLTAALQVAQIGTFEWKIDADEVLLDERSCAILGLQPTASVGIDYFLGLIDAEERQSATTRFLQAYRRRQRLEEEFRITTPSGMIMPVAIVCDWFSVDGALTGIGVIQDISSRKQDEERQRLIVRELHHRVKNSLATVQAVITLSLRHVQSLEQFETTIIERVNALARSHSLLTDEQFGSLLLQDVLKAELGPYQGPDEGKASLDGPRIYLPSQMATTMSLVIHELATNAVKYGALSRPSGKIDVRWFSEINEHEPPMLVLTWTETGGPRIVSQPTRKGFGTVLLRRLLGGLVGTTVDIEYPPEGLIIKIRMPLPS